MTRGWIRDLVGDASFEQLARTLSGSELQSVLLEVIGARAAARKPSEVLAQYERDRFCTPAAVDLRASVAIDGHLLAAAAAFEAIELGPVAPLAACSSVAPTAQHRVLSALRGTEVMSDPTNVLALECAARMRRGEHAAIHLATSQRVVRAQPVPKKPGHAQHFRLFALATGGIEAQDHAFTVDAVALHVRTMLDGLRRLTDHGYDFGAPRVVVHATEARAKLADRVALRLGEAGAAIERAPLDHAYYSGGLRYQIWVVPPGGSPLPLIDGGTFDWLTQLTANRRAVYVASGAGAQLIASQFASAPR